MDKVTYDTREAWLREAAKRLSATLFKEAGFEVPSNLRVSCGFPRGKGSRGQAIGQCHPDAMSADKTFEVFVSPVLGDPVEALAVLVHELVHPTVGLDKKHKGPFKRCALAVGLTGRMTATVAGDALKVRLAALAGELGTYPHAALTLAPRGSVGSRLLKVECPSCGYTVRVTALWVAKGLPTCPCGTEMELV